MADVKITSFEQLTAFIQSVQVLGVDPSNTTMALTGTNVRIPGSVLKSYFDTLYAPAGTFFQYPQIISESHSYEGGMEFLVYQIIYIDYNGYQTVDLNETIELSDGDTAYDRIDAVVYDISTNELLVVEGTAAALPSTPSLGVNQLFLFYVPVPQGSTSLVITDVLLYDENEGESGGEWDTATTGSGVTAGSIDDATNGIYCIKFSVGSMGSSLTLSVSTPQEINGGVIMMKFRRASTNTAGAAIFTVGFRNDSESIVYPSAIVTQNSWGLDPSSTEWQSLAIPLNGIDSLDKIVITNVQQVVGNYQFFIDEIYIQTGLPGSTVVNYLPTGGYNGTAATLYGLIQGLINNESSIGDVNYSNVSGSLEYNVVGNWYKIKGISYGPVNNSVTFSDGHATYDRYDLIVLNQDNTASIIQGTAEEDPQFPDYNVQTQVILLTKRISANQTEDEDVSSIIAYAENLGTSGGEFDAVGDSGVDPASTEQANGGTYSIKFDNVANGVKCTLTDDESHAGTDVSNVKFDVYLPSNQNQRIGIRFKPATSGLFSTVNLPSGYYGFDTSVVGQWQTVVLPAEIFNNLSGLIYDEIEIFNGQTGSNKTFFIDNFEIQEGLEPIVEQYTPTGGYPGTSQDLYDLLLQNSQRRPSVLSKASIDVAPPTENEGDRYLLYGSGTPNAGWDDQPTNTLVEFNGTSWVAETPKVGQTVYVINTDSNLLYKTTPDNGWYPYADEGGAGGGTQKQFVRFFHTSLNYNTTNQWKGWNATNAYNMLFDPFSQGFSTGSTPGFATWENVACVFLKGVKKLTKMTWSKKTQTASTGLSDIEVYVVITDLDYANEQVVVSDILSTTSTDAFITELVINSHTDFSDSSCLFLFERIRPSGAQTTNVFYGVQRILEFE